MERGKLIVIDGQDGTGKATQTALLIARMEREGLPVKTISFPQYGQKSAGPTEEYLAGKYGSAEEVSAYQASILFAVDRFDASRFLHETLNAGTHVVADRYVGSNMGHQGSKIADAEKRKAFYAWDLALEHETLGIPRASLNFILHIPTEMAIKLSEERGGWKGDIKTDIHETNHAHLVATERTYLELASIDPSFQLIECLDEQSLLLSKELIHEKIWSFVKPLIS